MSLTSRILVLALVASLATNVYLWREMSTAPRLSTADNVQTDIEANETLSVDASMPQQAVNEYPIATTSDNGYTVANTTSSELTIASLRELLHDENWSQLTIALREFLRDNPHDIQAYLVEAEMIARTKPLGVALVNYYTLLDRGLDTETQQALEAKIEQLFENATEQLRFDRAWDLLAELLEPLVQIAPNERRYLILLAEAYAQQVNEVLMENVLAGLPFDDPAADAVRQILARKQSLNTDDPELAQNDGFVSALDTPSTTRIPLERIGNQYMLELSMDGTPVKLMIDTGASTTAVTTRTWARLSNRVSSQYIGVFKVNTAAGFIQAPMFSVKTINLGPLSFEDVSVMVIPSRMMGDDPEMSPQGLLGMNILSQYNFQIDQVNARLLLSNKNRR
ncbi:retropepsin-like aspartic protease [Alteromonas facilis]|uniref:retropepsin-like aspartic protease n=1 Tax=Alteromonas facilis TaxID=2048004 RepID=UPI000C28BABA|nr:retropepsin-like aspartic protease [Alteromonas facilis]